MLVFFAIFKIKIKVIDLVFGIGLFIFSYSPYIYFHTITHFSNINIISFKDQVPWGSLENMIWSFVITSGAKFEYFLGSEGFNFFSNKCFLTTSLFLFWVYYFFAFAGFVYGIVSVAKKIRSYF